MNYFACDALHDSNLPLAAGMNDITAALPSFVVVAVSSWWGWYRRTVDRSRSLAILWADCCLGGNILLFYLLFFAASGFQCAGSI